MASKSKSEPAPEKTPKAETPKADAQPSLEKRVSYLERKLEQVFGIDLNKDGKIGFANWRLVFAMLIASAGFVIAADLIKLPTATGGTGLTVDGSGNLSVGGDLTSTDDVTAGDDLIVTDDLTVAGLLATSAQSVSITTNSYALTPTSTLVLMDAAQVTTNTIANPSAAGQQLILVNTVATNIVFADSGNLELSGTITLGAGDTLHLVARTTSKWTQISTSNN